MDETRVLRWPSPGRNKVVVRSRCGVRRPEAVHPVSVGQRRGGIAHLAIIADRPDVQAVLPQVMFHHEHLATLRALRQ